MPVLMTVAMLGHAPGSLACVTQSVTYRHAAHNPTARLDHMHDHSAWAARRHATRLASGRRGKNSRAGHKLVIPTRAKKKKLFK
jgi:hypothetical protein